MQTVALFGGTGYVGSGLRELLLQRGYRVRALVRDPDKAKELAAEADTTVIEGDLSDYQAVEKTVEGSDAVLVVTGARGRSAKEMWVIVEGTRNVLAAMEKQAVDRLIKLSGVSVRAPGEPFPLMRRLLDWAFLLLMRNPTRSKYLEQDDILSSNLDWTIVRSPAIVKRGVSGKLVADEYRYLGLRVAREDLCNFLIDQIESRDWVHRQPTVGYKAG